MRPVADRYILRGVAATLSFQFTDADGEPAAPAGAVTVGVAEADGTVVVAAGTSTAGTGTDPRTYTLAAQTTLELLTVTWTDAGDSSTHTQLVEVVGGYWFSVADASARDDKLNDRAKYPTPRILAVRAEVEVEAENITGQAWVPRYRREEIAGTGNDTLVCDEVAIRTVRSVRAYSSDGTTYTSWTAAEIAELTFTAHGTIIRPGVWAKGTKYVVEYEHGHDRPTADLRDAAITRLRHRLNSHRSGIPDRATSMSTEQGQTFALATPGLRGFVTGIPDVDVVYGRHALDRFGVA